MNTFLAFAASLLTTYSAFAVNYDVLIRNGTIYDGTGAPPYKADIAISGDRLSAIGSFGQDTATLVVDASGLAVTPGFFNVMSHAHVSLLADGRAMSDVLQGVTFEVLSEASLSPLSDTAAEFWAALFAEEDVELSWRTVDEYLKTVEASGVAPNFATFVSAATVRVNVLGMDDVDPTPEQLELMKSQVGQAMQDGALGLTDALIYVPGTYAETEELVELAKVAGQYGGIYTAHIRSEGNKFIEAIDETLRIGREANLPVKIHHLKAAGQPNWDKMDTAIARINALRDEGVAVTADMYTYVAGATGLDASMPTWVQAGGYDKWVERLKDPATRARVKEEMAVNAQDWENIGFLAGPDGMILLEFKNEELKKKYMGKTLTEVAKERGQDYRDTIIDLVIEDGSRVGTVYFLMSEENLKKQIRQPWVMFGSDADAPAAEGKTLEGGSHPRTYGNVARLLGKYVREEQVITLQEAVRRLTLLPAETLHVPARGRLAPGYFADVAIFDPAVIADKATFDDPHQYSIGMVHVLVNGVPVVSNGAHTGATPGRAVRGPGWKPASEG
ncbi:MAG: D-aminoacylase [Xanthomonadales bacterium]|nr:D-aminoacylase [Xanthomonadales bacterium]